MKPRISIRCLAGGLVVAGSFSPAWCDRKILAKPELRLETKAPRYQVEKDPATGNFTLRYVESDGKTWRKAVFEPATKIDVRIQAEVAPFGETKLGVLVYRYAVVNLASSRQTVREFTVERPRSVYRPTVPEGWRLLLPVFDSLLSGVVDPTGSSRGIAPGVTQGGFGYDAQESTTSERVTVKSTGEVAAVFFDGTLPGIVRCYARGKTDPPSFPTEPPKGAFENLPRPLEDSVTGRTMGAVPVPSGNAFDVADFLARIRAYNDECVREGWQDAETGRKHSDQLDQVVKARQGGNRDLAESLLGKFLETLTTEANARKLETEAFGILYYNATYLVGKL